MGPGNIILPEILGTATLVLFGVGVVANVLLPHTKGFDGGWLLINFGWGLGVFAGVYVAAGSGAHINPAVTLGLYASGGDFAVVGDQVIEATVPNLLLYWLAQMVGAFLGATLAWAAYKNHFDEPTEPAAKLGCFSTGPQIRNPLWNTVTEIIATFFLVLVVLLFGNTPAGLGPLAVALLVVGIGASLGGPTGYAINPARDLGPRLAHAVLPIKGKGGNDWGYAWVPVLGPLVGGLLAGLVVLSFGDLSGFTA